MVEAEIIKWMRAKVEKDGFETAADLARAYLNERHITSSDSPGFALVLSAGFKVAAEVYGPFVIHPDLSGIKKSNGYSRLDQTL